jgi:polygalacturonase
MFKSNLHPIKLLLLLPILISGYAFGQTADQFTKDPKETWKLYSVIKNQIKPPVFKNKEFLITKYGAVGDGKTLCTVSFKKAIDACNKSGGGRVIVPIGIFLTGPINLKNNVELHLQDSAKILFSRNLDDYLPVVYTRFEGKEVMNYSPLIYTYGQENVGITGHGILDGNADRTFWWPWSGSDRGGWKEGMGKQFDDVNQLVEQNKAQVPAQSRVYGKGHYLRPNFIQFFKCKNILISDVKIVNSPMWNIHPLLCENVSVIDVKIISFSNNTDGCNPESSKNVLIKNCYFDTGDDCIAIKSGQNEDGRRINIPSENIIIEDCLMKQGHGGIVLGSEASGGIRNVFGYNCNMDSPTLLNVLRIKTNTQRGGIIENVYLKNIKVGTYRDAAINCSMFYSKPGDFMPKIRNIIVEDLTVEKGGQFGIFVNAYKESPLENLKMINCKINNVKIPVKIDNIKSVVLNNVKINGQLVTNKDIEAVIEK